MNILVVSNTYPLNRKDNTVVFLRTLYEELAVKNKIRIIAADHIEVNDKENNSENLSVKRFRYWFRAKQNLAYGDAILSNMSKSYILYLLLPFFFISMLLRTFFEARRDKPDIIHANWVLPCGLVALIVSKILRVPLIVTSHGGDLYGLKGKVSTFLSTIVIKYANVVNPVSQPLNDILVNKFNYSKGVVIPMGVDTKDFYHVNNAKEVLGNSMFGSVNILFVGRLSEKKGISYLIDAITLVKEKIKGLKLLIVGKGNLMNNLQSKVASLDLLDIVDFIGEVQNDKLKNYYSAADILVLPSVADIGGQEGLPVTLMEGLICNCKIIATDSGGMKALRGERGINIIEQRNSEQIAESILRLVNEENEINTELIDYFKIDNISNLYLQLYKSIING